MSYLPNNSCFVFNPLTSGFNCAADFLTNFNAQIKNQHGVQCRYYKTTYSTTYNKIFGEDRNRQIERRFDVQAILELPKELQSVRAEVLKNMLGQTE